MQYLEQKPYLRQLKKVNRGISGFNKVKIISEKSLEDIEEIEQIKGDSDKKDCINLVESFEESEKEINAESND